MIEFIDVHKTLGGQPVLRGLSFKVQKSETFGILGRSGCGKSVTLKHLVGLMKPDSGKVMVDGAEITRLPPAELGRIRKNFGFLFQASALLNSLTVADNIALPLREHRELPETEITKKVREVLSLMDLGQIESVMPSELSGGMKKRVALARAIIRQPEIILYDEPTTGLDPIMANVINDLINRLHQTLKVTSIVVTHDMNCMFRVAHRIALLHQGKIIALGTPEEFQVSKDPYVSQFISGAPQGPFQEDSA